MQEQSEIEVHPPTLPHHFPFASRDQLPGKNEKKPDFPLIDLFIFAQCAFQWSLAVKPHLPSTLVCNEKYKHLLQTFN